MAPATLKTIARATGFSVTTVSRALGGFSDVSEETRRLIVAEARRQGYEPNLQARALQKQHTRIIALIVPPTVARFPDPFFSELVAGIGSVTAPAGFDLLLSIHAPLSDEIDLYRRMIVGRRVDGLILIRARYEDVRIRYLSQTNVPYIVLGRTTSVQNYVYIDVDGAAGQAALTRHLIDLGHRRIAYITPPRDLMFTHYRLQGFREVMDSSFVPVDEQLISEGDMTERSGHEAARSLLDSPDPPTAIMTGNDLMALGVMSAIHERGLRVGQDIAVGGFDDIPLAEHIHPSLTTVRQPIYEIGQQLTQTLLHMIGGQTVAEPAVLVQPELIVRASSGPARR